MRACRRAQHEGLLDEEALEDASFDTQDERREGAPLFRAPRSGTAESAERSRSEVWGGRSAGCGGPADRWGGALGNPSGPPTRARPARGAATAGRHARRSTAAGTACMTSV